MAHVTTSWKRLLIVIVIGLAAVLASRRISASHQAPAEASRTNAPRDGAHGAPISNDITDFQQLD